MGKVGIFSTPMYFISLLTCVFMFFIVQSLRILELSKKKKVFSKCVPATASAEHVALHK